MASSSSSSSSSLNQDNIQAHFRDEWQKSHPELYRDNSDESIEARGNAEPERTKYVTDKTLAWLWASNNGFPCYNLVEPYLNDQKNKQKATIVKASNALISALPRHVGVYMAGGTALVCLGQPGRTTLDLDFFFSEDVADEDFARRLVVDSLADSTFGPNGGFVVPHDRADPKKMPLYYELKGSPEKPNFGAIMPIDVHPRRHFGAAASGGIVMPVLPSSLISNMGTPPLSLLLCAKLVAVPHRTLAKQKQDYEDIKWLASDVNIATIKGEFISNNGVSVPKWTQKWKPQVTGDPKKGTAVREMVPDGYALDDEALYLWKKACDTWVATIEIHDVAKPVCFLKDVGKRDYLPKR